ncbi:MAG: lipopolysaccharide kinase InaA family protein, partial [Methylophilaceae bacterium]
MIFEMPAALRKALGQHEKEDAFVKAMTLRGKPFRDVPGRKTSQVELLGKSYFIKQHFGVGWGEIVKNIISLKKPILGAMTEVYAIQKVTSLGIATTPVVAYGQRGCNPANTQSF